MNDVDKADLIGEMAAEAAMGCCGDASWRGRYCQYHQGYEDGLDAMMAALDPA